MVNPYLTYLFRTRVLCQLGEGKGVRGTWTSDTTHQRVSTSTETSRGGKLPWTLRVPDSAVLSEERETGRRPLPYSPGTTGDWTCMVFSRDQLTGYTLRTERSVSVSKVKPSSLSKDSSL